jgi:hypothetical protein
VQSKCLGFAMLRFDGDCVRLRCCHGRPNHLVPASQTLERDYECARKRVGAQQRPSVPFCFICKMSGESCWLGGADTCEWVPGPAKNRLRAFQERAVAGRLLWEGGLVAEPEVCLILP